MNCCVAGETSCDGATYRACVSGTYRTGADGYEYVCTCGGGHWDGTASGDNTKCCGDDGAADDWVGTGGVCQDGVWVPGNCIDDDDCGLCQKCVGTTCTAQTSSEDLKNECSVVNCYTGFCDGASACNILSGGEEGTCSACKGCLDSDSDCDNVNDNAQDTVGSNTCSGLCQACQSGSCSVANVGSDPGNDCTVNSNCNTGNCKGGTAECGWLTTGEGSCPS